MHLTSKQDVSSEQRYNEKRRTILHVKHREKSRVESVFKTRRVVERLIGGILVHLFLHLRGPSRSNFVI